MITVQQAYQTGFSSAFGRFKLASMKDMLQAAQMKGVAKTHPALRNPATFMTGTESPLAGALRGGVTGHAPVSPLGAPLGAAAQSAGKRAACAKFAAVFGADVPSAVEHAAIPYDQRRQMYEDYARTKSQEQPTGYGKAMGIGGGLGAAGGALLGGLIGQSGAGAGIGAGLGGLTGAGLGALAAHGDKSNIEHAQHIMSNDDNLDPALAQQIQDMIESRESAQRSQRGFDRWQDRSRHSDVMDALRNRGGNI